MKKLYFTKAFITLIDEKLSDEYTDKLKREDFFKFFYILEHNYSNKKKSPKYYQSELPSNIREKFGRYTKDGKQYWKFIEIINICEDKDIIYSSSYSNFKDKKYCKSYRYTKDFINNIFKKEIEFDFLKITDKTYDKLNKDYKEPTDPILKQHYETIKKLNINYKRITDYANDLEYLEAELSGMYEYEEKHKEYRKLFRMFRDILKIQYNDRITVIQDERTGRIFTTFNLMNSELREECTYNGEKLDSIDLKSSQPYLLASLLIQENPNNKDVKKFYNDVTNHDIYRIFFIESYPSEDRDIADFEEIIDEKYSEIRKNIKIDFFRYLYKDNRGQCITQSIMRELYPDVYELIKERKRKKELWLELQKLEADIFIPVVNRYVHRGCLSVHDSIYFPESMKEEVISLLKKSFKKYNFTNYSLH